MFIADYLPLPSPGEDDCGKEDDNDFILGPSNYCQLKSFW